MRLHTVVLAFGALTVHACGTDDSASNGYRVASVSSVAYGDGQYPRQTCNISYVGDLPTAAVCDVENPRTAFDASYGSGEISSATLRIGDVVLPVTFGSEAGKITTVAYDFGDGDSSVWTFEHDGDSLVRSEHRLTLFGNADTNTHTFLYSDDQLSRVDSVVFGTQFSQRFLYAGSTLTSVLFSSPGGSGTTTIELDKEERIVRQTSASGTTNVVYDSVSGNVAEIEELDENGATVEKHIITYEKAKSVLTWSPPMLYGLYFDMNGRFRGKPDTNTIDWLLGPEAFLELF